MMETLSLKETRQNRTGTPDSIHWKQLWSLAALYASVVIGWIAYQNYQPRLLARFGFTDFAFPLMVAQGIILVMTPLIAGQLGDRLRAEKGHRLPIISAGISIAAMVFMAVAFTLLADPGDVFRWVLPILIILWLISMSIFTSPALSTIELFTPVEKLPYAMAILTITGNAVNALEPVIVDIIDYAGAPLTFISGGAAVLLSGYALKTNSIQLFRQSGSREVLDSAAGESRSSFGLIFILGLGAGAATTFLFYPMPLMLAAKAGVLFTDAKVTLVGMLLISAVLSLPISIVANRLGVGRVCGFSFATLALSAVLISLSSSGLLLAAMTGIFIITFTSVSVTALPLAISHASLSRKVFCVGIFFSGAALPNGIWEALQAFA